MRHNPKSAKVAALVTAATMIVSACTQDDGDVLFFDAALDQRTLTAVFEGEVLEDLGDHHNVVKVSELLWERSRLAQTDGGELPLVPIVSGEEIVVVVNEALAQVSQGQSYVFVTSQTFGAEPSWASHAVYEADSMKQLSNVRPDLSMLLNAGESGPADLRVALVELMEDVAARSEAQKLGQTVPPPGPRTERAWAARGFNPEQQITEQPIDPNLGMPVDDYVALGQNDRQLLEFDELPGAAVARLDLVPFDALVLYPDGFDDQYWGIGFRTPAGLVGPYELDAQGHTEIHSARPRVGAFQLIAWTTEPFGTAADFLADSVQVTQMPPINPNDLGTIGDTDLVVVDIGDGTAAVLNEFDALDLIN